MAESEELPAGMIHQFPSERKNNTNSIAFLPKHITFFTQY